VPVVYSLLFRKHPSVLRITHADLNYSSRFITIYKESNMTAIPACGNSTYISRAPQAVGRYLRRGSYMQYYTVLWPIHGILMALAFLAMLLSMFIARYGKQKITGWYKKHRMINLIGVIGAAIAMIIAGGMVSLSHGMHIASAHAVLGVITFLLIVITPIAGFGIRSRKVEPSLKKKLRYIHHWLGRLVLVLMAVTIFYGLRISGMI